jgi:hypothetical protein
MLKLKPITIIALDPYAASFCESVRQRLELDFGTRGRLIQTYVLTGDGGALNFESNLAAASDPRFDLQVARTELKRPSAEEAHALFEREAARIEPTLIDMFGAGRRAPEMEAALREGIEIVRRRMIFLMLSSSDPFASGVVLDLAQQIRWLFATRFSQELFDLQLVVLLPGLFEHAESPDYAATYMLLKRLDHSMTKGMMVTAQIKGVPPFEACWLMDGYNARGDELGSLAENLKSYSDAFTGFLTAEPEMSGALVGTRTSRGKAPAYSAFGHGELYYPASTVLTRLSSALARDVITRAFLADDAPRAASNSRQMLLAAKEFVLRKDYRDILDGFDRDKGKLIWQDHTPSIESRAGSEREYVSDLQRSFKQFGQVSLPGSQRRVQERGEEVKAELERLVDVEIDQRADASPGGLGTAVELLKAMTDPDITLRRDVLGENPQNLITEQRDIEGKLDPRLGVTIDRSQTKMLLDRVHELRSQLISLQTTLRLTPVTQSAPPRVTNRAVEDPPVKELMPEAADGLPAGSSEAVGGEEEQPGPEDERQQLIEEIEATEQEIQAASSEYQHAIIKEDRDAHQIRYAASQQARETKAQAVASQETEVVNLGDQIGEARQVLDELRHDRQRFLQRNFMVIPIAALALIFGLPAIAALVGFGPAQTLVESFWNNMSSYLFWLAVAALAYASVILYLFAVGINRQVNQQRERVEALDRGLHSAKAQLRNAHNDQLKFEYERYAQGVRVEVLGDLIDAVRQKVGLLEQTQAALAATRADFARQHEEAQPLASTTRRPILYAIDIDTYYEKVVQSAQREADTFARDHVKPSQVRRITTEEFREKLKGYADQRFEPLTKLSIEDVLLREPELLSERDAYLHLRELDAAAEPLVQLREVDVDHNLFAQRDVTLWAGANEHEQLLARYRQICPQASARPSEDEQRLTALTRCLNYPAYFLSQIDFYRACYERTPDQETTSLPDLIPDELGTGAEMRRAHEKILLALVTGLIQRSKNSTYTFVGGDGTPLPGQTRRQIAEKLATDFTSQQLYADLCERLEARLSDHDAVHQKLTKFLTSAKDLEVGEQDIIDKLSRKYHPLG